MKQAMSTKETMGERVFNIINVSIMLFMMFIMVYPFWHIVMFSLSDQKFAATGGFFFWPRSLNWSTYEIVLANKNILSGFKISVLVTVCGTLAGVLLTAMLAYALSKKSIPGYTFFTLLIFFTMLFGGGMIPSFMLIHYLNLFNHVGALILPGMVSAWNFFIMRNFFTALPEGLEESARIDGASELRIFWQIVLPLSKAVLATIGLFLAVGYWNDFFSSVLYIVDKDKWSLQAVLRQLIGQTSSAMSQAGVDIQADVQVTSQSIIMASIIITTLPILCVYPFLQKYFVKGVLVGSVKG